jgi:hypothetical protein
VSYLILKSIDVSKCPYTSLLRGFENSSDMYKSLATLARDCSLRGNVLQK